MRWRAFALAAAMTASVVPCRADPVIPRSHVGKVERHPRFYLRPRYGPPFTRVPGGLPPLLVPPRGQFVPPPVGGFSPLERDQLPSPAPLSQGFHLTVPMLSDSKAPTGNLNRAFEVGRALGACWSPPANLPWNIITLRLSFKRDGSINGEPRIPFADAGSAQRNSDLAHSLLAALKQCTPLSFSPSLGSAIAGEIFAISFTHQDQR